MAKPRILKKQVIELVARKAHLTKKSALEAVNVFLDEIGRLIAKGDIVTLSGFGTFESRWMEGKTVRIPKTDKFVNVKKHKTPRFTPGRKLKKIVSK